jgi:hypothetical protein
MKKKIGRPKNLSFSKKGNAGQSVVVKIKNGYYPVIAGNGRFFVPTRRLLGFYRELRFYTIAANVIPSQIQA